MYNRRVDKLTHPFLVAAREENEVVWFEGEVWGGPRQRMLEFVSHGHLSICVNSRFGGSLGCALLAEA